MITKKEIRESVASEIVKKARKTKQLSEDCIIKPGILDGEEKLYIVIRMSLITKKPLTKTFSIENWYDEKFFEKLYDNLVHESILKHRQSGGKTTMRMFSHETLPGTSKKIMAYFFEIMVTTDIYDFNSFNN